MHIPVLLNEAIKGLQVQQGHWYIDATFGRGGHTGSILKHGGNVIAFDVDHEAIAFGQENFKTEIEKGNLILVRENFDKLGEVTERLKKEKQIENIAGILFDFGTSSDQLKDTQRGFSFDSDAELDMRMDDRLAVKAKDFLAVLSEKQLMESFFTLGGEKESRKIAKAIVWRRKEKPIETVRELLDIIEATKHEKRGHLNPATKVFQALRILVNSEMYSIEQALPQAYRILEKGGRIVTISFHEGEDRLVKEYFRSLEKNNKGLIVTKNVVTAQESELQENPRSRSAKLRTFEKN